jgi:hypothetical protein
VVSERDKTEKVKLADGEFRDYRHKSKLSRKLRRRIRRSLKRGAKANNAAQEGGDDEQ